MTTETKTETGPKYLATKIVASKHVATTPGAGMTRDGYTKRSGAPTGTMIKLEGEKIWRRVMVWCWSNSGTCFVKIKGECLIVREYEIPAPVAS
jgi:hypothetical protein